MIVKINHTTYSRNKGSFAVCLHSELQEWGRRYCISHTEEEFNRVWRPGGQQQASEGKSNLIKADPQKRYYAHCIFRHERIIGFLIAKPNLSIFKCINSRYNDIKWQNMNFVFNKIWWELRAYSTHTTCSTVVVTKYSPGVLTTIREPEISTFLSISTPALSSQFC